MERNEVISPAHKPLRVGSFCSGIAAPETAWSRLGWVPIFFSEIDPFASAVLAHRYPGVPNLGDMEAISAETLRRYPVDVVVAGTPCQSFSVAGLRGGMADPRGNLALVLLRLVDVARPAWLVWENVPGVLSSDDGRDFGSFLGALGQLGYGWAYRVLDAQYAGVPQRRRRVFVVGHLGDWRRAAAVLFERHSLSGHPAPSREAGTRVAASLTRGADSSGEGGYAGRRREDDINIVSAVTAKWAKGSGGPAGDECQNLVTHSLRADRFDASEDGTGRGTPLVPVPFDTTQITSAGNYSSPQPGDLCHPLAAGAHPPAVAFDWQSGGDSRGLDPKPTAQLQREQVPAVAYQCHGSNVGEMGTVRAGNGNETGGVPFIAFAQNQRDEVRDLDEVAGACAAEPGMKQQTYVAYTIHGTNKTATVASETEVSTAVRCRAMGQQENSSTTVALSGGMAVRRLLPIECERLQGFPDNWTLIPFRGKPAKDGPRYRAIGNSMAIPVLEWVGRRIDLVRGIAASAETEVA